MDERDFQAMQEFDLDSRIAPTHLTPKIAPPSWCDIYRYAKHESEWYEKERQRLVATHGNHGDIEEAVRQFDIFDEIRDIADLHLMNACQMIAIDNGILNPFVEV